ncbi:TylF/MycF/NovP-related O-methyltransferase [[Clostridium] fimetarium]|uniref:Macrocin-O-methyltransferase (TylF) n=1 Tax=[Clostridium] fimetarium TaxID=99656 RepID=A0A1I0P5A3_9FIRM|nr:TylF/MycF/NovP-related O-methyltransferase [[Clostridium] fimetarium]SEW09229.1 Macrocin-O-methyltransferase (TylF) [[Clostridium] fimetarium]
MKKIIIWGIGIIYEEFKQKLLPDVEIIAYIDSFKKAKFYDGKKIYKPSEFIQQNLSYDFIVIASVYTNDIFYECKKMLDMNRIIFLRPLQHTKDVESFYRNVDALTDIAPKYRDETLLESDIRMGIDEGKQIATDSYPIYYYDYFRYRTFELIADQIQKYEGDIAEVGVFKGYFASIINRKFPSDTLYLFDTFEGFDAKEANKELYKGNCDETFIETFKQTTVEQVLKKLPYRENCIIKKGFFPMSAEGIDTKFKFVSIDVDFENSIYASIKYFYPRLVKGGFIFIHDYNEQRLKGVRKAVKDYENEHGSLIKIPIADKCGTLIITK